MASSCARSASGMIPPTTTGASTPASRRSCEGLRHQREVGAREDREADDVDVLVAGRGRDLGRREPDALVDDLHAGVAGRDRDLLGAVGVAVEAGLADEQPDRAARSRRRSRRTCSRTASHLVAGRRRDRRRRRSGARYSPNTSRSAPRPLADGAARLGERDRRGHEVLGRSPRPRAASLERGVDRGAGRARRATAAIASTCSRSTAGSIVTMPPRCAIVGERRRLGLGERVDADDLQLARLDAPHPLGVRSARAGPSSRRSSRTSRRRRAPTAARPRPPRTARRPCASTTFEPSKRSPYSSRSDSYASTCWMRSDHCWSHGVGRPSASFQHGSWIGAGPRVLRQRDAEHLEHDALHVVLGLLLGEAERVHLHAVAEAAQLRVGRRRSARGRCGPTSRVNARILHISSTKRTPASMKNEMRPTTSGNSSSGTWPESRTASSTAIALASPYASSCTGVAPASCRWYGHTLIGFHVGHVLHRVRR